MANRTGDNGLVLKSRQQNQAVSVSETSWGYIVGRGALAIRRASLGELFAMAGCIILGFFAYATWLLPGSISSVEVVPLKIAITIMFFVFSALLYLIARRGLSVEVQIDIKSQKVRLARRNRENGVTVIASYHFSDIDSVYMKRSQSPFVADRLFIQPKNSKGAILVATGSSDDLEPLLSRFRAEFRRKAPVKSSSTRAPSVKNTRRTVRTAFASV